MRGFTSLTLGALSLGMANAWTYPDCEPDNCYREMIDTRFIEEAKTFCPVFLAGTTTAATAVPTDFNNCANVAEVSSACSCITYTYHASSSTSASSSSSSAPVTTSSPSSVATTTSSPALVSSTTSSSPSASTGSVTSTSSIPSSTTGPVTSTTPVTTPPSNSTSSVQMTTSTIYSTTVRTITSCASTVTNCPAKSNQPYTTTEIIAVSTTVCPLSSITTGPSINAPTSMTTSTIYSTSVQTITSCAATVTNCPARPGHPYTTTVIVPISTTVCPVSSATIPSTLVVETAPASGKASSTTSAHVGTVTTPAKTTGVATVPAAGAGRLGNGVELAAAAALGVLAALL